MNRGPSSCARFGFPQRWAITPRTTSTHCHESPSINTCWGLSTNEFKKNEYIPIQSLGTKFYLNRSKFYWTAYHDISSYIIIFPNRTTHIKHWNVQVQAKIGNASYQHATVAPFQQPFWILNFRNSRKMPEEDWEPTRRNVLTLWPHQKYMLKQSHDSTYESYQFKSLQWTNSSFLHSPCLCGSSKTNHISMSFKPHPCSGAHLHRGEKASVMRRQGANSIGVAETHLLQGSPEISPKSGSFTIEVSGGAETKKVAGRFFLFQIPLIKILEKIEILWILCFFLAHDDRSSFFCMCKVSVALFWRKILVGSGSYFTRHDVVTNIW